MSGYSEYLEEELHDLKPISPKVIAFSEELSETGRLSGVTSFYMLKGMLFSEMLKYPASVGHFLSDMEKRCVFRGSDMVVIDKRSVYFLSQKNGEYEGFRNGNLPASSLRSQSNLVTECKTTGDVSTKPEYGAPFGLSAYLPAQAGET